MDIRGQFSGFVKKKGRRCEKKVYVTYEARKLRYVLPINLIFTRDRLNASMLRHILGQFKCAGALEIMRLPLPLEPWCQLAVISAA
jgi:hypothetical protein